MPESGAVYQPTTVGYSYDNDRDIPGSGIRNRILSRFKFSTAKWLENVLLSVALCVFVVGFFIIVNNFAYDDEELQKVEDNVEVTKDEVKGENSGAQSRVSVAAGAAMMLFGLLTGCVWAWLKFFRRTKLPRSGMVNSGGQYGPVLTELPTQTKVKPLNSHIEAPSSIPLSDQEEETHTLMQASSGATNLGIPA